MGNRGEAPFGDVQHHPASYGGSGRLSCRSELTLPFAGVLVGSLCTLLLLTFSRSNAGLPWRDLSMAPSTATTHTLAERAQAVKAQAPACPTPPACEACPAAEKCPRCPAEAIKPKASESSVQEDAAPGSDVLDGWQERLTVPWGPLLTQQEAQRGLAYYGSGSRLQELAAKLVAGKPIKMFTLGASVTRGIGTTDRAFSYASRFFEFITTAFPHKKHKLINRGIGGTSSAIYSVCAEHMVHEDADLVVLEFSANDKRDAPYSDPERKGYEQLIRKLLKLPGRPALLQLHHYAWWHAVGDGVLDGGLFYYPAGEAQLGVFAQYYDFPSLSVRNAMWHLMRARVDQFNPDKARLGESISPTNVTVPGAEPGKEKLYWYRDRTHPGDEGHGMMAELLAHVLAKAVVETLAPRPRIHLASRDADLSPAQDKDGLPLPMVPGNAATPTTLCAIEEDFKDVVSGHSGDFSYKPEKKDGRNFVEQKWGWSASKPGSWAEMEFDTESGFELLGDANTTFPAAAAAAPAANSSIEDAAAREAADTRAEVSLSYLRSYAGMGVADVECVAGCECEPQVLDGTWEAEVSLQQILQFRVSRHKRCRVRITVADRPGVVKQDGHKVVLTAVMVSQFTVRLTTYDTQVDLLHKATI